MTNKLLALAFAALVAGCGNSSNNNGTDDMGMGGGGGGGGGGNGGGGESWTADAGNYVRRCGRASIKGRYGVVLGNWIWAIFSARSWCGLKAISAAAIRLMRTFIAVTSPISTPWR